MKKIGLICILMFLVLPAQVAFGWCDTPEELTHRGFSPESIRIYNLQTARMENGPDYIVERTRPQQFWFNVVHNDWLAPSYPFGEFLINY